MKMSEITDEMLAEADRIGRFLDGLTPHDLGNFQALMGLPRSDELIEQMPDGEYKEVARLARKALSRLKLKRKRSKR